MRILKAAIGLATLAIALSCSDPGTEPATTMPPQFASNSQVASKSSLDLIEADIDSGLLDKNNGNRYRAFAVLEPGRLPGKYRSSAKAKDATYSMVLLARDWNQLSASAKQEILDVQANGFGKLKETAVTPHFVLHYTTQGSSAVPAQDANGNGVSDFIDAAAASWENVWAVEVGQLGYPAPIGTPAQKFHVYYIDMPFYGYASPENVVLNTVTPVPQGTASAYIAVENDFVGFPPNDEDRTGQEVIRSGAIKVTQAHEFMHAIQFAINVYQSGWLMESHATWAEDIVYDHANDWRWYIDRFLATPDLPLFSRYLYGGAFFQHWLSETRGVDVQRQIWLAARTATFTDAIRNVGLGGSWEGIKQFAPAEYLLDVDNLAGGTSVVPTPQNVIRATHSSYPVSVSVGPSTNKAANGAPWGLGANFIDFLPGGANTVTLSFDGTDGFAWRAFAVGTPSGGGSPVTFEIPLSAAGAGSITINGLGTRFAKLTLIPTIADQQGVAVPYSYGAVLGSTADK